MIRKLAATVVAAGVLTVGVGGAAFAKAPNGATPPPSSAKSHTDNGAHSKKPDCSKAPQLEARLEKIKDTLQARIDKEKAALDRAKDAGKADEAQKIEARLDKTQKRLAKVEKLLERLHDRCPAPSAPAPTPGS
jgi:hypothetical protein